MNENLFVPEYKKLCPGVKKVYVVPSIDYSSPQTNYLYRLYEEFFRNNVTSDIEIESLSVFAHPKFLFSRLKNEQCILHYHWFEVTDVQSILGMIWKLFWILLYRIFGGKIIWTVHNKFPHDKKYLWLNKINRIFFAQIAHRLHVHCKTAVKIMSPILNVQQEKFFIVTLPEFPAIFMAKKDAREALTAKYPQIQIALDHKIFLMFGAIAEYKGIIETINIFKQWFSNKILIIAGPVKRWDTNYFLEVMKGIKEANNIFVIPEVIPEDAVPLFMNSTDYALFNYKGLLTSASVALALSYKKYIIAPSIGCLTELQGDHCVLFAAGNNEELKNILLKLP